MEQRRAARGRKKESKGMTERALEHTARHISDLRNQHGLGVLEFIGKVEKGPHSPTRL
jgi:hypothetical protein